MFTIEFDREDDGRWIAEIPSLPGVMAYGATKHAAMLAVEALALRVLADRLEQGEQVDDKPLAVRFVRASARG